MSLGQCSEMHLSRFLTMEQVKPDQTVFKKDRQRFLQQVSKKQFRTVYYNANTCGQHKWMNNIAKY